MSRPLYQIAQDIEQECSSKDWYVYAEAYVTPMQSLVSIEDNYFDDTAKSIVAYALCNLTSWRGDKAREVKAELKALLK
jgi:hypothetical protein